MNHVVNDTLTYKGYVGEVMIDFEAGVISGMVAGTRDVIHFEGKSVKEVRQAFRDSIDEYLDFCEELGQAPEPPPAAVKAGEDVVSVAA